MNSKLALSKRGLAILRRASLVFAVGGALYMWQRYEWMQLPAQGCSPLIALRPGSRLWVDRRPSDLGPGDVLFFTLADGAVGFARCSRTAGPNLWLETDNRECPGQDSDELGWIARDRIHGRLVMAVDP